MLGELKTVNGLAAGGGEQEADAASLRALQASKSPAGAAEPKASGLCGCGCGRKTTIARWNDPVRGKVRGQPMRFIRGHSSRRPEHIARLVARIQPQGSGLLRFRVDPATGCWLWSGSIGTGGYGQIWADGKVHWAHRYAYEQVRGKVPAGYGLRHTCRNRRCINPDHMEPEPRGEIARHSKFARLTWADVAVMRRDFAAGTSRTELVKRYGVHPATINRVLNGSAWSKPVGKSQTADARPIVVGTS